MLTELCRELNNWFVQSDDDKIISEFSINDGALVPSVDLGDKQFYRIVGSLYNDGIHQEGDILIDETFDGGVWKMHIPPEVIELSNEIDSFRSSNDENSPYSSESFGGYSYSKATSSSGAPIGWRQVFADRLRRWRKL